MCKIQKIYIYDIYLQMASLSMTKYSSSVNIGMLGQILNKVLCHSSKYTSIKIQQKLKLCRNSSNFSVLMSITLVQL